MTRGPDWTASDEGLSNGPRGEADADDDPLRLTFERAGIRLTKSLIAADDALQVEYYVSSTRASPAHVTIREFPGETLRESSLDPALDGPRDASGTPGRRSRTPDTDGGRVGRSEAGSGRMDRSEVDGGRMDRSEVDTGRTGSPEAASVSRGHPVDDASEETDAFEIVQTIDPGDSFSVTRSRDADSSTAPAFETIPRMAVESIHGDARPTDGDVRSTHRDAQSTDGGAQSTDGGAQSTDGAAQSTDGRVRSPESVPDTPSTPGNDAATDVTSAVISEAPSTLVGIPAYNEAATIEEVVAAAKRYADAVFVVDDGSTDDTAALARDAGAYIVQHPTNRGYGATMKTIFQLASRVDADSLAILDADGQHDASDVPVLVEEQRASDADIVIASRFVDGGSADIPPYRWVGIQVINVLVNLSMRGVRGTSWVTDTQSGFRVYGEDAIDSLADDYTIGDDMGASTDILHHAHRHEYVVEEVGSSVSYSVENASTRSPVRHGLSVVSSVLGGYKRDRPMTFLGIPGVALLLFGTALSYQSVTQYLATNQFPAAVAVFATVATVVGLLACLSAVLRRSLPEEGVQG